MVNYIAKNVLLQDINTKEYLIPYTENKLPIGTIIPCLCSSSWTPQGTLPLDGAEYSSTQFPSLWNNYLTVSTTEDSDTPTGNSRLVTCTYTEYASDIATYGQCAKFAVDTTNNKFKVPLIKDGSYIAQAKSDSELGKCYNESLPNITGYIKGSVTENSNPQAGGAFNINHTYDSGDRVGQANWTSKGVDFNASRSSSTYQDNAKVQGDNVRLRWFVVVANGTVSQSAMDWSAWATGLNGRANTDLSNLSEDGTQIIKTVSQEELNNPFSLFDSKYSVYELNNLSWLKSAGQWNAKAVYPTAYDKILENVNNSVKGFLGQTMYMWGSASGGYMTTSLTPVVGSAVYNYDTKKFAGYVTEVDLTIPAISLRDDVVGISYTNVGRYTPRDESSSAYITDYDFVLKTADETFRLPLKNGDEYAVSDNAVTIGTIQSGYVFDKNCIAYLRYGGNGNTGCQVLLNNVEVTYFNYTGNNSAYGVSGTFRANRGDVLTYTGVKSNDNMLIVNEMVGNGSLYFYVGETVQNANLINAGRIEEQLATKTDMLQASGAGMPSTKTNLQVVGASGATYTAPANGWYCGFCQEGGIRLSNKSVNSFGVYSPQTVWSGGKAYIPCQKGDKIIFEYAGTTTKLIFYYAEGGTTSGGTTSGGTSSGGTTSGGTTSGGGYN